MHQLIPDDGVNYPIIHNQTANCCYMTVLYTSGNGLNFNLQGAQLPDYAKSVDPDTFWSGTAPFAVSVSINTDKS